ncbi:MAG TPA: MoaD/ThiS family protein [Chthoniobacterales bacterium]|nr:MoaD/ThiS family protein [Chthoniobacterales bacterium]
MQIQIQYFSQLRDLNGPASIELPDGATVAHLLDVLFSQHQKFAAWNKHLLVAAGTDWVDRDHAIQPGETISLMPPVQGG